MAMEPEAMIPLTLLQPQQVILIGDHRQLRPVVTESMASRFGLETSLFERHCNRAVMLTTQYRMVSGTKIVRAPIQYKDDILPV